MSVLTYAMTYAKSRFGIVTLFGLVKLLTASEPLPAGNCSNTAGGTVNVKALTGAVQMKEALNPEDDALPVISAKVPAAPPVQLTVTPDDRFTVPSEL